MSFVKSDSWNWRSTVPNHSTWDFDTTFSRSVHSAFFFRNPNILARIREWRNSRFVTDGTDDTQWRRLSMMYFAIGWSCVRMEGSAHGQRLQQAGLPLAHWINIARFAIFAEYSKKRNGFANLERIYNEIRMLMQRMVDIVTDFLNILRYYLYRWQYIYAMYSKSS